MTQETVVRKASQGLRGGGVGKWGYRSVPGVLGRDGCVHCFDCSVPIKICTLHLKVYYVTVLPD